MLLLGSPRIFETGPKLIPGEAAKVKFGSGAANSTSLFFCLTAGPPLLLGRALRCWLK